MAAWSAIVVLSGFSYNGATGSIVAAPMVSHGEFQSIWSTGTGWGTFSLRSRGGGTVFTLNVLAGTLTCRSCEFPAPGTIASILSGGSPVDGRVDNHNQRLLATFSKTLRLAAKDDLRIEVHG
jgi:non-lysosomal glucosylceramidase